MLSQIEIALLVTFLISFFISITLYGICCCKINTENQPSESSLESEWPVAIYKTMY